jgi:hypothetical protein
MLIAGWSDVVRRDWNSEMAVLSGEQIGSAASFLLAFLEEADEGCAEYSLFYDGTEKTAKDLREWIGFEDSDVSEAEHVSMLPCFN